MIKKISNILFDKILHGRDVIIQTNKLISFPNAKKFLSSIDSKAIVSSNRLASFKTFINVDSNDITACGTSCNALLHIIPSIYKHDSKADLNSLNKTYNFNKILNKIKYDYTDTNILYGIFISQKCFYNSLFGSDGTRVFPGHCFLLWKISYNEYILIQSFSNRYHFNDNIKCITKDNVVDIIKNIKYFYQAQIFDSKSALNFMNLTGVDFSYLVGYKIKENHRYCEIKDKVINIAFDKLNYIQKFDHRIFEYKHNNSFAAPTFMSCYIIFN
jgi:hypothetical protein